MVRDFLRKSEECTDVARSIVSWPVFHRDPFAIPEFWQMSRVSKSKTKTRRKQRKSRGMKARIWMKWLAIIFRFERENLSIEYNRNAWYIIICTCYLTGPPREDSKWSRYEMCIQARRFAWLKALTVYLRPNAIFSSLTLKGTIPYQNTTRNKY